MKQLIRQHLVIAAVWMVAILLTFAAGLWWFGHWYDGWSGQSDQTVSNGSCNIAVVPITGNILSYDDGSGVASSTTTGDSVVSQIQAAQQDQNIQGVMLNIDSYGGSGAAGEQIMNAIKRLQMPSVALIRSAGTSAAYFAAVGANQIIASDLADVGSIGVTESYVQNVAQNQKDGLQFIQLSSGPYKDSGNPNTPLTAAEQALIQRDLHIYANVFIDAVAANRHLSVAKVQTLADGSSMPASLGLKNGLVDQIGDVETARAWFAKKLNVPPEQVVFCQ